MDCGIWKRLVGQLGCFFFFLNGLDEVMQAGDPKQQIGWATPQMPLDLLAVPSWSTGVEQIRTKRQSLGTELLSLARKGRGGLARVGEGGNKADDCRMSCPL